MQFNDWCQQVDSFLKNRQRGVKVSEIDADFLWQQFHNGTAPVNVALAPTLPRKQQVAQVTPPVPPQPAFHPKVGSHVLCPVCQQMDQVQRLEGLVLSDIRTMTAGIGTYNAHTGISAGGIAGQSGSVLSKQLAPPSFADPTLGCLIFILVIAALMALGGLMATLNPNVTEKGAQIVIAIGSIVVAFVCMRAVTHRSKINGHFRMTEMPNRYLAWQQLHYCGRCAVVIDPITKTYSGVAAAKSQFPHLFGGQSPSY